MKLSKTLLVAAVAASGQLFAADVINLSARAKVGIGFEKLNTGVVVVGSGSGEFLVMALGPSMEDKGVPGTLDDPVLKVVDIATKEVIVEVDDWEDDPAMADRLETLGLDPEHSSEAATIVSLPAGSYTAQVTGFGGTTGIAQVVFRELGTSDTSVFNGFWQKEGLPDTNGSYPDAFVQTSVDRVDGQDFLYATTIGPDKDTMAYHDGYIDSGTTAAISSYNAGLDVSYKVELLSNTLMTFKLLTCTPVDPGVYCSQWGTVTRFNRVTESHDVN